MFEAIYRSVALRILVLMAFIPVAVFWFGAKALGLSEWLGLVALIVVVTAAFIWRRGNDPGRQRAGCRVQGLRRSATNRPDGRKFIRTRYDPAAATAR